MVQGNHYPSIAPPSLHTIHETDADEHFPRRATNASSIHDIEHCPPSPVFSRDQTINGDEEKGKRYKFASFSSRGSQDTHKQSQKTPGPREPGLIRAARFVVTIRWRGVLAIIAGVFSQMLCWGLIMTYGTILAFYVRYLIPDTEETLITLAGAIPPFCLLALALPWGRLLDAGHHCLLNVTAGVSLTGGLIGLGFTGSGGYNSGKYWAILCASIPMGIGQSIYFLAAPQVAKTWHPQHKGFAMGITNSGAAIGGVAWPLIFDKLVMEHGFREGVFTLAGISGALSVFIILFSRPAPEFHKHRIGEGNAMHFRTWWPTGAFRSKVFVVHVVSMCFVYLGILTVPFFIEVWARRNRDIGVTEDTKSGTGINIDRSEKLGVYLLITLNGCQLPGRLFGSTMCDKFQARKIHALACFCAAIIVASSWFEVMSFAGGMTFAALFGAILGVMVSLPINDAQDILGHERTYLLGEYAGAVYTCASPFIFGGAVISGVLVEYLDVFIAPGVWCISCFMISGTFIIIGLCMKDDTACFEEENDMESDRETVSGPTRVNSLAPQEPDVDATAPKQTMTQGSGALAPGRLDGIQRVARVPRRPGLTTTETARSQMSWSCAESPY